MENRNFKFIIRGKNKDEFQREVLDLLKLSNHKAYTCRDGAGIEDLTFNQVQKAVEYICIKYPGLSFIVK